MSVRLTFLYLHLLRKYAFLWIFHFKTKCCDISAPSRNIISTVFVTESVVSTPITNIAPAYKSSRSPRSLREREIVTAGSLRDQRCVILVSTLAFYLLRFNATSRGSINHTLDY